MRRLERIRKEQGLTRKHHYSPETLAWLIQFRKGRKPWNKGLKNPYSKKTLKNMSKSIKAAHVEGRYINKKIISYKGINNPMYGKKHSKQAKEKIRIKALKRWKKSSERKAQSVRAQKRFADPKQREAARLRAILSHEKRARTKLKRSAAAKQTWIRRKQKNEIESTQNN